MTARVERQPHVVRDRESRRKKAAKIIALLSPFTRVEGKRVLISAAGQASSAAISKRGALQWSASTGSTTGMPLRASRLS